MKIGIDIRTLMDAQYSGVSEYTYNLVNTLLKLDFFNEYRLFYNSLRSQRGLARIPAEAGRTNAEVIGWRLPNKILNYLLFKYFNYPRIDKVLRASVFFMPHINFIGLSASGSTALKAVEPLFYSKGGCKRILTIHDLSFLRYPEFFSARKDFWHKMINVKKLVKKFDRIIAVSENTKRDIVELCGVNPDKVKVIYSGVEDIYKPNYEFDIIRNKYNLPDKFILFLGTVEPRKNIDGLIRAYEILKERNSGLPRYKLVIAGGDGWRSEGIYRVWRESKYKSDIKFLGYIEKKDKVYLYNLASLFVYPSFYEGFGFPPLEAMASGTPVITSFTSSLPEIVGGAGLMVDPYNINDLAIAMEKVLTDNNLRNDLIQKGLKRIKEFSWEKAGREYLELFQN